MAKVELLSFLMLVTAVIKYAVCGIASGRSWMRGSRRDPGTDCCRVWSSLQEFLQTGNSMEESMRRVQPPAPRQTVAGAQKSGNPGSLGKNGCSFLTFLRVGEVSQHSWIPRLLAGKRVGSRMCGPQNPLR